MPDSFSNGAKGRAGEDRAASRFGSALSAVGARKRATLRRIAADYAQVVAPSANIRFDVVAVNGDRLSLHRNAF
jgi:Holliday junction resolvase-like predicted endonuclease